MGKRNEREESERTPPPAKAGGRSFKAAVQDLPTTESPPLVPSF